MLEGQLRSQNLHSAILYDIFMRGKVERAHFHAFSSHFLKENPFSGGSCVGVVGVFGPKGVFGCQVNVQKVSEGWPNSLRFGPITRRENIIASGSLGKVHKYALVCLVVQAHAHCIKNQIYFTWSKSQHLETQL